jgi:hypothetical protein
MFAWIKNVAAAANRLARNLAALADSVGEANDGLRRQLGLDAPARVGRKPRGEVLEHSPAGDANGEATLAA